MAQRRMSLAVSAASMRPTVIGRSQAVACGHYLAALASMRVLDAGGNAVDAGVTAAMALAVLQPDIVSFAGVAPTLIYLDIVQSDPDRIRFDAEGIDESLRNLFDQDLFLGIIAAGGDV